MRLFELTDTIRTVGGSTLPPPTPEREDGGGPKGGKYWYDGSTLVKIPVNHDYGVTLSEKPEAFGLTTEDVLAIAADDEFTLRAYTNWLGRPKQGEWDKPCSHLGGRQLAINFLLMSGWCVVEYEPPQRFSLTVHPSHLQDLVAAVGKRFALMTLDEITVWLTQSAFERGGTRSIKFHREDYPGFAGPFKGFSEFARTGRVPVQDWLYIISDQTPQEVASHGLVAREASVTNGGSFTPRAYRLDYYVKRMVDTRPKTYSGHMYRIAIDAVPETVRHASDDSKDYRSLYAKQPFSLPAADLQVRSGAGWQPVAGGSNQ